MTDQGWAPPVVPCPECSVPMAWNSASVWAGYGHLTCEGCDVRIPFRRMCPVKPKRWGDLWHTIYWARFVEEVMRLERKRTASADSV